MRRLRIEFSEEITHKLVAVSRAVCIRVKPHVMAETFHARVLARMRAVVSGPAENDAVKSDKAKAGFMDELIKVSRQLKASFLNSIALQGFVRLRADCGEAS